MCSMRALGAAHSLVFRCLTKVRLFLDFIILFFSPSLMNIFWRFFVCFVLAYFQQMLSPSPLQFGGGGSRPVRRGCLRCSNFLRYRVGGAWCGESLSRLFFISQLAYFLLRIPNPPLAPTPPVSIPRANREPLLFAPMIFIVLWISPLLVPIHRPLATPLRGGGHLTFTSPWISKVPEIIGSWLSSLRASQSPKRVVVLRHSYIWM